MRTVLGRGLRNKVQDERGGERVKRTDDMKGLPKAALVIILDKYRGKDDDFGAVLNCAVRYCIGRRTYMPKLVIDYIMPLLSFLSKRSVAEYLSKRMENEIATGAVMVIR